MFLCFSLSLFLSLFKKDENYISSISKLIYFHNYLSFLRIVSQFTSFQVTCHFRLKVDLYAVCHVMTGKKVRLCGKIMRRCFNRLYSYLAKEAYIPWKDEGFILSYSILFYFIPFHPIPFCSISSIHSWILKLANKLEEGDSCHSIAALPVVGKVALDPHSECWKS